MASKRVILVTGCSTGIGAHCARRLREDGWTVHATARKDEDLAALREDGFVTHYLDYREPYSIEECFKTVIEASEGRLDALFNNGAYAQPGAVEDLPVNALREQFEANFFGWHHLTRLAVPVMRGQGSGRIVFNSSVLGFVPMPWRGAYTASKYAVEGLAQTLRMELSGTGIHVSLVEPGPIPSNFMQNAYAYAVRNIDVEHSVHSEAYEKRLAALKKGDADQQGGYGSEPVYAALAKALNAQKPRAHYPVTPQTRAAGLMRRFLPTSILYELLRRSA